MSAAASRDGEAADTAEGPELNSDQLIGVINYFSCNVKIKGNKPLILNLRLLVNSPNKAENQSSADTQLRVLVPHPVCDAEEAELIVFV